MKYILLILLIGCTTTASRTNGETLKIRGAGKAVWSDGSSIERESLVPKFPPIKYQGG